MLFTAAVVYLYVLLKNYEYTEVNYNTNAGIELVFIKRYFVMYLQAMPNLLCIVYIW